ncbi:MAG: hypothetical protein Q7J06_02405 [Bacteroidales bacterium]|nr:hypothetical protein [Bacteroidales bacterium]
MSDLTYYESRVGKVTSSAQGVFNFVTDMRNFDQFIPHGTINNWKAEIDSCSFNVAMLGTVSFLLAEKEMYNKVVYTGDALKKNDSTLVLDITEKSKNSAEVKVSLKADINPMLKVMDAKPIEQFLEILINEMERFRGWEDIKG